MREGSGLNPGTIGLATILLFFYVVNRIKVSLGEVDKLLPAEIAILYVRPPVRRHAMHLSDRTGVDI